MKKEYIISEISKRYDYLNNQGFEVVGVFLQGSQNYNLSDQDSDIDTRAVVLPQFKDILLNKSAISTTCFLDNNEQIDIKDIRIMFEKFKKQNINFLEILFTEYKVINPKYKELLQPIFDNNEKIARINIFYAVNSMFGMYMKSYEKIEKVNECGYNPKQLCHTLRFAELIERYIKGEPFKECLIPMDTEYLLSVKNGMYPLEKARELMQKNCKYINNLKEEYLNKNSFVIDTDAENILDKVMSDIMKCHLRKEII